jgi:hypothetical protein
MVGVPLVFFLTLYLAKRNDWLSLASGLVGKGDGFWLLPAGIPIATFLGAFAYAGAGGNLNLAQSLYVKEKGYGMGKFSGRITNILKGKTEKVTLEGTTFDCTPENVHTFKIWWRRINIEHGIVFWLTGAFTMILLSLLAYSTVYGSSGVETSINFVIHEAEAIKNLTIPFLGTFFLVMAGVMLFGTQFSVLGSTSRIMAENLVITSPKKFKVEKISKYFFTFLWAQIIAGVVIFSLGFTEPLALVVTGAVLNAFSMFVYSGLILKLNRSNLEKPVQPSLIRILVLVSAFLFYGIFSAFTVYQRLF